MAPKTLTYPQIHHLGPIVTILNQISTIVRDALSLILICVRISPDALAKVKISWLEPLDSLNVPPLIPRLQNNKISKRRPSRLLKIPWLR